MQIIDEVLAQIEANRFSSSSEFLAMALASSCSRNYSVSLIDASTKLDASNMKRLFRLAMIIRLAMITKEPDFSNADQEKALSKLRVLNLI